MIKIKKSETADSRTCDWSKVTKQDLTRASYYHISDVKMGIFFLIEKLNKIAENHDYTKITKMDQFHSDFQTGFKETSWYEMHQEVERHHLKDEQYVQDDVNLLDILEMIVDGVMAGMARSGEYRKEDIPDELLRKAFDNTIKLMLKNIEVEE